MPAHTDNSRILQVRIKEDFHKYCGRLARTVGHQNISENGQGFVGYPLNVFPVGLELNFDYGSKRGVIVIAGRNGSGKTTFLQKLAVQLNYADDFSKIKDLEVPDYFDIVYSGEKPYLGQITSLYQQNSLSTIPDSFFPEKDEIQREILSLSAGQFARRNIDDCLYDFKKDIPNGWVLYLDQPENNLDMLAKREINRRLYDFADETGMQIFIATNDVAFITPERGIVLNLFEEKAFTQPSEEFNLEGYLE